MVSVQFRTRVGDEAGRIESEERGRFCARYRLSMTDWEDIRQDASVSLLSAAQANPALAQRLTDNASGLRAYFLACLRTAALQRFRKQACMVGLTDDILTSVPWSFSANQGEEDAKALVERIASRLDRQGKLVLDIARGATTLRRYVQENAVSERTASRHFVRGVQSLRHVAQSEMGAVFGCQALDVFREAVSTLRAATDVQSIPQGVWRMLARYKDLRVSPEA